MRTAGDRAATPCRISGLGAYRPSLVVHNAAVGARLGLDERWIRQRTGIRSRRHAAAHETIALMAITAARAALEAAASHGSELDCVIVTTQTHLTQTPPLAPEVAHHLGARPSTGAFDLRATCAGFCVGLAFARDLIASGSARRILIVASERVSDVLDHDDHNTAMIFGDGAGAAVVEASDEWGVGATIWGSDGSLADALLTETSWIEYAVDRTLPRPALRMDGAELVRAVLREGPDLVKRALLAADLGYEDIRVLIAHQANARIIDMLARRLELPEHVTVARDIEQSGNTSAASIPLAMQQILDSGSAKPGDLALLVGYGAGFVHAAQVVRLPEHTRVVDAAEARI